MTREELLQQTIVNPVTKNNVTIQYALKLPKEHAAYKAAAAFIQARSNVKRRPKETLPTKKEPLFTVDATILGKAEEWVRRRDGHGEAQRLQEYGDKYLNGVSPLTIASKYLETIYDPTKDEIMQFDVYTKLTTYDGKLSPQVKIGIRLKNGTSIARTIKTSVKRNTSVIENDYFELGEKVPAGTGHARRMLQETIKIADSIGAEAVLFEASLSAGGYVWAKYGGIPTPDSREVMYHGIYRILNNFDTRLQDRIDKTENSLADVTQASKKMGDRDLASRTYDEYIRKHTNALKMLRDTEAFVKANPQFMSSLHKLLEQQIRQYDISPSTTPEERDKRRTNLSPELLSYIANTPLGKFLLLDTSWTGYFNMRKGSLGRKMLEDAVN